MKLDFWKNKRVLITGHTGFKGSWLSLWLQQLQAHVCGIALEPHTEPNLFTLAQVSHDMESHIIDINDFDNVQRIFQEFRPEIVIHMAAQALVRRSYRDPLETFKTNILGTAHILEAAKICETAKVIINVTSDKCYENKERLLGYSENETLGGHDPYSASKACSELVTTAYRNSYYKESAKGIASVRAGNIIGGGDWSEDRLVPDIIKSILRSQPVNIRNPQAVRPWQHVLEPLSGYLLLVEKLWHEPQKYSEAWNFGPQNSSFISVKVFVETILKLWEVNKGWELQSDVKQPHESTYLTLDISKAVTKLQWLPRLTFEQGLQWVVDWYQAWANGKNMREYTLDQIAAYSAMYTSNITRCEVCQNPQLTSMLDLGLHPLCDDLVPIGDTRICNEYPIKIVFCENCLTAHQQYQVPKQELFPSSYHYRARFTADVLKGMRQLVESCEHQVTNLEGKKVLDIGCNDGSLLNFFKEKHALTLGVEPTDACHDAKINGHITFKNYFNENIAQEIVAEYGKMDIITFTNVFAHIENLEELLTSLKILISPHTTILIENHYLGSILKHNQFDTFYHEHPRTYSFASFEYIARSLNMSIVNVEFPSRYGGNIRVFLGKNNTEKNMDFSEVKSSEKFFTQKISTMQTQVNLWREKKLKFIEEKVRQHGKLSAKAFPGRAAILIKLLGLNEDIISAVYEKPGSLKIGNYVPGTRIPIRSDDELFSLIHKPPLLLNFAWHISDEIREYLKRNNYTGSVIDILNEKDFMQKEVEI